MIQTPVNQKLLTNVAIVKLKKGGKTFEVACYRNKISNWRAKQETEISEVIQIDKIFTNATRGEIASKEQLTKAFGNKMSQDEIFMEILNKGEYQVSDLEREAQIENIRKEIAHYIVEICINSKDNTSFPLSIIVKAINESKAKIDHKKPAKKQAIDILKDLEKVLPIKRARMRINISFQNLQQLEKMSEILENKFKNDYTIEKVVNQNQFQIQAQIEPHLFRDINDIFQQKESEEEHDHHKPHQTQNKKQKKNESDEESNSDENEHQNKKGKKQNKKQEQIEEQKIEENQSKKNEGKKKQNKQQKNEESSDNDSDGNDQKQVGKKGKKQQSQQQPQKGNKDDDSDDWDTKPAGKKGKKQQKKHDEKKQEVHQEVHKETKDEDSDDWDTKPAGKKGKKKQQQKKGDQKGGKKGNDSDQEEEKQKDDEKQNSEEDEKHQKKEDHKTMKGGGFYDKCFVEIIDQAIKKESQHNEKQVMGDNLKGMAGGSAECQKKDQKKQKKKKNFEEDQEEAPVIKNISKSDDENSDQ